MARTTTGSAADFLPTRITHRTLKEAAAGCRGCDLFRDATQTVFGEGPADAEVMVVGEQPGDREDREGRPFVGPAGLLLDRALERAGIDLVKPHALVLLGATAAQALLGKDFRVTERRGELIDLPLAPVVSATVHPSSIPGAPDEARTEETEALVRDLTGIARALERSMR
jgi:uracil-DNA glycosylase